MSVRASLKTGETWRYKQKSVSSQCRQWRQHEEGGWDDPCLFYLSTAGQWTNSRLHLLLIDWPVRARQCTRRQNKPCCYTSTHEYTNLSSPSTGKVRVKWIQLLLIHRPDCGDDRRSQNGLIQETIAWLSELPHGEFWPWVDLYMWVVYSLYWSALQLILPASPSKILQVTTIFPV